jgi:hypothetical protein
LIYVGTENKNILQRRLKFLPLGGSSKQTGHTSWSLALRDKFSLKKNQEITLSKLKVEKQEGKI